MSRVFQVIDIVKIWPPKTNSPHSKQMTESDGDGNNNKFYLRITDNFYTLVHVMRI